MKITVLPAFPPKADEAMLRAKLTRLRPIAAEYGATWANQMTLPDGLDMADAEHLGRRIAALQRDRRILEDADIVPGGVYLNQEVPTSIKSEDAQVRDYRLCAEAVDAAYISGTVHGAFDVPSLTKNGTLDRALFDSASIWNAGLRQGCFSTYMRRRYVWRDCGAAVDLLEMLGIERCPYVSAQFMGDRELLSDAHMHALRWHLEGEGVSQVIVWANMVTADAVPSIEMCLRVFGTKPEIA